MHTHVPKSWPTKKYVRRTKMCLLINAKKNTKNCSNQKLLYFIASAAAKVKNKNLATISCA